MADKMWDILRFLKNPGEETTEERPLPQESLAEKGKIDTQLIAALSKAEAAADAALEEEKAPPADAGEGAEAPPPAEGGAAAAEEETAEEAVPPAPPEIPEARAEVPSAPEAAPERAEPPSAPEIAPARTERREIPEPPEAAPPEPPGEPVEKLLELPLSQIVPNPFQPRRLMGEEEILELTDSIRELGVLQPILVKRAGSGYELIAGERRFRAAQRAGLEKIPAMVMETDQLNQQIIALVENIQRKNLSAIEEARSLQDILAKTGWSQTELARRMGRSQAAIANKIRLLKLDESVQDLVISGKLGERQARSLLGLSLEEQGELAQKAVAEDLSARALETLSETWQSKPGSGRRAAKREKGASDGPAGELLHDLATLINRHREQGVPAQWRVKQMDQNALIVEISVEINRDRAQNSLAGLEAERR